MISGILISNLSQDVQNDQILIDFNVNTIFNKGSNGNVKRSYLTSTIIFI